MKVKIYFNYHIKTNGLDKNILRTYQNHQTVNASFQRACFSYYYGTIFHNKYRIMENTFCDKTIAIYSLYKIVIFYINIVWCDKIITLKLYYLAFFHIQRVMWKPNRLRQCKCHEFICKKTLRKHWNMYVEIVTSLSLN